MRTGTRALAVVCRRLSQAGGLLPSVALCLSTFVCLSLPTPEPTIPVAYDAPSTAPSTYVPLAGALDDDDDEAPEVVIPVVSPRVTKIENVLARRAEGLGLQVRRQLAEAVVAESDAAHLDPLFVLSVMQVESEFDEGAMSNRGAHGLMQIRPVTLAFVAQREGIRLPLSAIEHDPVLEATLAIRYLGRMVTAFKGNLDLALMAYNAGPHRVNTALIEGSDLSPLGGYPRSVRRAWQKLHDLPSTDDTAVASRER
jgi:soluble lytic murein transglycosylase